MQSSKTEFCKMEHSDLKMDYLSNRMMPVEIYLFVIKKGAHE